MILTTVLGGLAFGCAVEPNEPRETIDDLVAADVPADDGMTDAVQVDRSAEVLGASRELLQTGSGERQPTATLLSAFNSTPQVYPPGVDFGLPSPTDPITGDFNGDGRLDYARLGAFRADVFFGAGSNSFTATVQDYGGLNFGAPSPFRTITGDFNGDGRTDYARLGGTKAFVYYGSPSRAFTRRDQTYVGIDFGLPTTADVVTGDFNGDHITDYARLTATRAFVFFGTSIGFIPEVQEYPLLDFQQPSPWQAIAGDFNGDGKGDYARLGDIGAYVFLGNADRTFQTLFQPYPGLNFGLPSVWVPITGDFNADGRTDYARVGPTGAFVFDGTVNQIGVVWPTNFQNYHGVNFGVPSLWQMTVGDFNGDGATDYARLNDVGAWVFLGHAGGAGFSMDFLDNNRPSFGLPSPWQVISGTFNGGKKASHIRLGGTSAFIFNLP